MSKYILVSLLIAVSVSCTHKQDSASGREPQQVGTGGIGVNSVQERMGQELRRPIIDKINDEFVGNKIEITKNGRDQKSFSTFTEKTFEMEASEKDKALVTERFIFDYISKHDYHCSGSTFDSEKETWKNYNKMQYDYNFKPFGTAMVHDSFKNYRGQLNTHLSGYKEESLDNGKIRYTFTAFDGSRYIEMIFDSSADRKSVVSMKSTIGKIRFREENLNTIIDPQFQTQRYIGTDSIKICDLK